MSDSHPKRFEIPGGGVAIYVRELEAGCQLRIDHSHSQALGHIRTSVLDAPDFQEVEDVPPNQVSDHVPRGPDICATGVDFRLTCNEGDLCIELRK